jgi:YggT family protein
VIVPVLSVILIVLNFFQLFLFLYLIFGWMQIFNLLNQKNKIIYSSYMFLSRVVEPVLFYARQLLEKMNIRNIGSLDLSPLFLLLVIYLIQGVIGRILLKFSA